MKAVEAYQIAEQIHAQVTLEQYLETIYEKIKEYAEAGEKCILFLHAVDALPYPQPAMQEKIKNSLNNEGYSTTIQSRGLQISWEITEAKEEIPAPNNESSALPEVPTLKLSPSEEKTVLIQIGIPHDKDLDYQGYLMIKT